MGNMYKIEAENSELLRNAQDGSSELSTFDARWEYEDEELKFVDAKISTRVGKVATSTETQPEGTQASQSESGMNEEDQSEDTEEISGE